MEVRVYEYKSDVYRLLLKMGTWLTGEYVTMLLQLSLLFLFWQGEISVITSAGI